MQKIMQLIFERYAYQKSTGKTLIKEMDFSTPLNHHQHSPRPIKKKKKKKYEMIRNKMKQNKQEHQTLRRLTFKCKIIKLC